MSVNVDIVVDIDRRGEPLVIPLHLTFLDHWRIPNTNQLWG